MPLKRIGDTEKLTVGALRTALQTLVAPQLSDIADRLTRVEARLDGVGHRFGVIEKQLADFHESTREVLRSMRNEMDARFNAVQSNFDMVRGDIKRLDVISELRERIASLEAKLAQQN
ncbi:MAG: hypothetical protein ACREQ4_13765 [Candidatus Binataceae bacterium]